MAGNRMICTTNQVEYLTIRKAMVAGARTFDEIQTATGVCGVCPGCISELEGILSSVCGCKQVSLQAVVDAVKAGADTVEKVGEITGAGTDCGRCKGLVANIIELGY
jgi:bacterioferritin-associated ferredoxin